MEEIKTDSENCDNSRLRRLLNESHDSESDGESDVSRFYVREKKECASMSPLNSGVVAMTENIKNEDSGPCSNGIEADTEDSPVKLQTDSPIKDTPSTVSATSLADEACFKSDNVQKLCQNEVDKQSIVCNNKEREHTESEENDEEICEDVKNSKSVDDKFSKATETEEKGATIQKEFTPEKVDNDPSGNISDNIEEIGTKSLKEIELNEDTDNNEVQSKIIPPNDDNKASVSCDEGTNENELSLISSETLTKQSENIGVDCVESDTKISEKNEEKKDDETLKDSTKNKPDEKDSKDDMVELNIESEADMTSKDSRNENDKVMFLKKQLLLPRADQNKSENTENEDMDDIEDFDPSLLCPDISMDVDESPVITTNNGNGPQNDGCTSPLPYEATFSTYVDEMTGAEVSFDLTPEEYELRSRIFGPDNQVQFSKIHCTACNVHLGSALDAQKNRFVHPLLKVLICRNCYHFYTSGEFEKDEDGSELYCRWCGQGGQVLCCSTCEFVFCKKCIKNNFGLKKFKEIRDSDDWTCFRCEPTQLSILRASCAEFMDYVRNEISRAATLIKDVPSFMTTDYTTCCSQKKKEDSASKEPKRRKRKLPCEDPDYNPVIDMVESEPPEKQKLVVVPTSTTPSAVPVASKPILIAPKPSIAPVRLPQQSFRVGNTMFRPKSSMYPVSRPPGPSGQVRVSGPGYIKILPQKPTTTTVGTKPNPVSLTNLNRQQFSKPNVAVQSLKTGQPNQPMKHEWFEKTVRAAARVNSNLSYTLTQLNRKQASAVTVEALAIVHNKLQEVLSTSINSLIQIRKNLRSEFINGIKSIKFPPKQQVILPKPQTVHTIKDDDDVIFVSKAMPVLTPANVSTPISKIVLPPSVTLKPTKKSNDLYSNPSPSTSFTTTSNSNTESTGTRPSGYIKVKSFSALQNVPSECITIPDDPPPPLLISSPRTSSNSESVIEIKENNDSEEKTENINTINDEKNNVAVTSVNLNNLDNSPGIKGMMKVAVILKKSPDIEKLIEENCKIEVNGEDLQG